MGESENKKKHEAKRNIMNNAAQATAGIKPPVYDMIGRRLRDYYDGVSQQPVPDRFLDLLNQLEAKTTKKDS